MPELTAEDRARNVRRVREAAQRLAKVESQLLHALAILPGMVREVQGIRSDIEEALSGAPAKKEAEADDRG